MNCIIATFEWWVPSGCSFALCTFKTIKRNEKIEGQTGRYEVVDYRIPRLNKLIQIMCVMYMCASKHVC